MRIIAGKHRGKRLESGKIGSNGSNAIRPTSDFAREAIFNILMHGKHVLNGQTFIGKPVLDVFCGTGALGLEALSRGATQATFIDQSRDAIAIARQNAERMHETGSTEFVLGDAVKLPLSKKSYALVFLDPPYFSQLITPALESLRAGGWMDKDVLIVAEHDVKEELTLPPAFETVDERRYGRAMVRLIKLR